MTKHILIADDEASFRFAASLSLRQKGYEVSEAENGADALMKIKERNELGRPFDLVVIDIQMPCMSGIEVLDELKRQGIVVPVVFLSGYADEKAVGMVDQSANSCLLRKPFMPEQMLNMVELMMN